MSEPKRQTADPLEVEVAQAMGLCDSDVLAALRSALVANSFLLAEVERLSNAVSFGSVRGRLSPERKASAKLDGWREMFSHDQPSHSDDS